MTIARRYLYDTRRRGPARGAGRRVVGAAGRARRQARARGALPPDARGGVARPAGARRRRGARPPAGGAGRRWRPTPRRSSRHSPRSRHWSRPGSSPPRWPSSRPAGAPSIAPTFAAPRAADAAAGARSGARPARPRRRLRLAVGRVHDRPPQRPGSDLVSEAGIQVGVARTRAARDRRGAARPAPPRSTRRPSARPSPRSMDPELPMLSVVDLGMVHRVDVAPTDGPIHVELLPTFVGCPALELIKASIAERLGAFGRPVEVDATFGVPWTPSGSARPAGPPCWRPASRRPAPARPARRRPHRPRAARPVPALRLAPDDRRERVRADPVPVHPLLPRLPPAVRSDQAGLMEPVALVGRACPRRRHRRGRDDGRRDRPGRARGRLRGRPPRRRRGGHRARRARGSATGWRGGPRSSTSTRTGRRLGRRPARPAAPRRRPLDGLADEADLVIEAALEDLALKRTIFRALDAVADAAT